MVTNVANIYLTTQDRAFNQSIIATKANPPGVNLWGSVQILGGYYQEMPGADPNRYYKIDELKVNTSGYIGPPPGFVVGADTTPPSPPTGVTIQ